LEDSIRPLEKVSELVKRVGSINNSGTK